MFINTFINILSSFLYYSIHLSIDRSLKIYLSIFDFYYYDSSQYKAQI